MGTITQKIFGTTKSNERVNLYILNNGKMEIGLIDYGCVINYIRLKNNDGAYDDVALGFDNIESYENSTGFLGTVVGRFANRLENAEFELNGVKYSLYKNDGDNSLHGGKCGFDKKVWSSKVVGESIEFSYLSPDGEENYPGNLSVSVRYKLTDKNEIVIDYYAKTDKDTVLNMTNHSFFNLSKHDTEHMLEHEIKINADKFTVINDKCLPTGEIKSVDNTPFDLREYKRIGSDISSDNEQLRFGEGYDHNFIINESKKDKPCYTASLKHGDRVMNVYTTKPAVQFYSGNHMTGKDIGFNNTPYTKRSAVCLETQLYPNSMKHTHFPSPILKKEDEYKHTTIYEFVF